MTKIYLVRHGSVHNPREILYGRLPHYKLSSLGWKQARRAAAFLAAERISAIYSSPRLRARQTARALAEAQLGATVRVSALLDEVRTGWQGADSAALGRDFNFYEPRHNPSDETIDDIFRRMSRFVRLLLRRHTGQSVACVSHGDPIIITRIGLAGRPLVFANLRRDRYPAPASLSILRFSEPDAPPELEYIDPNQA